MPCDSEANWVAAAAKKRKLAAARGMSRLRASDTGLPQSRDSAMARRSWSRSISSARRASRRARSDAGVADQTGNTRRAAATAPATSALPLSGASA